MNKFKAFIKHIIIMQYFHFRFDSKEIDDRVTKVIKEDIKNPTDWNLKNLFKNIRMS